MLEKMAGRMLSPINTAGISILGLFNLLMGIWIILPFDSISGSLPEIYYGIILIGAGISILIGSVKEHYMTLAVGTRLSYYLWFLTMLMSIFDNWHNSYWIVCLMIACYGLFVAANIKVNRNNLPFKNL